MHMPVVGLCYLYLHKFFVNTRAYYALTEGFVLVSSAFIGFDNVFEIETTGYQI